MLKKIDNLTGKKKHLVNWYKNNVLCWNWKKYKKSELQCHLMKFSNGRQTLEEDDIACTYIWLQMSSLYSSLQTKIWKWLTHFFAQPFLHRDEIEDYFLEDLFVQWSPTIFWCKQLQIMLSIHLDISETQGPSWSYGSWIYNYLCNQFLSPLKLWVRTQFVARCARYNIIW